MRTKVIKADSIEAAVERILAELREDDAARSISGRNNNVIYFDGWDGLGASTVLRAVSQRLAVASEAPAGLKFDQIIHVDCSKWENRRVLQRAIAEQLELPAPLMDMFDRQDEEDEFNGVSQESRLEIPQILRGMHRRIQDLNRRFLVIFHNGSNEEIDLASFGFPLSQYLDNTNKVLWTFQGRFRLYPRNKVDGAMKSTAGGSKTDVFLSARHSLGGREPHEIYTFLVHLEAAEVTAQSEITINTSNGPAQVGKHFLLHMLKLCCMGHNLLMDYDLTTHACNYWICDGIIQRQGDGDDISTDGGDDEGLWRAAAALQREMRLDVDYYQYEHKYFPSQLAPYGMWTMPNSTASYEFLAIPAGAIPNSDMFQDFNKLRVLKLSRRTFSFSSPPFIYCNNLKFLWLHHCQDQDNHSSIDDGFPREKEENKITTDGAGTVDDFQRCFQRLWVLDVRYTRCDQILSARMLDFMTQLRELNVMGAQDWDICQLQGRLPNIRKLRVTKSTLNSLEHNLILDMSKLELLDLSGNCSSQEGVTKLSGICISSNELETVMIIDNGWAGIQKLSFTGCAKLRNVLLSGLFEDLYILDLSGTVVKTLDLSAMTARRLDELILDNCDKLCAIVWPPTDKRKSYLNKVHCDTTWSAASLIPMEGKSTTSSLGSLSEVHGGRAPTESNWCIRVRDARFLRSLVPLEQYFNYRYVHMEIYSSPAAFSSGNNNKAASSNSSIKQQHALVNVDEPTASFVYADVGLTHPLVQPSEGDAPMLTQIQMWPCPRMPSNGNLTCYTHIQDHHLSSKSLPGGEQTMTSIVVPDMICRQAYILHVHDNLAITSIPGPAPTLGSTWNNLRWCRVERCPNLEHVFTTPQLQARRVVIVFEYLETFWASKLPKARYIWDWTPTSVFQFGNGSFRKMTLLHMDLCPRLIHVLPLALPMMVHRYILGTLGWLETLEIMWCADLREVFPLFTKDAKSAQQQQQSATSTVYFPFLSRIHLHELPKLQGICGQWRMSAPMLETVKIRGCWNLKRLPAVGNNTSKKVECDCEKDWWDTLEWDGLDAYHHPSLYKATHSRYYKKTLLKGSVLR